MLRAGSHLIDFLEPGRYCGIDPCRERVDAALEHLLEPKTVSDKAPRFDYNASFDAGVFHEQFDLVLCGPS